MISTVSGATKARGFTISWVASPEDACGIEGKLGLSFAPGKNCSRGGETWSRNMCDDVFSSISFDAGSILKHDTGGPTSTAYCEQALVLLYACSIMQRCEHSEWMGIWSA
jgi:hypothetical protein